MTEEGMVVDGGRSAWVDICACLAIMVIVFEALWMIMP
jgi:hypothetical protein